ncbi:MAG: hypothetical protein ACRDY5_03195, partial [Acidimicrobiales bacterium]
MGSVVVLAGLLVGIPVVLARSVGWPLPETAPDWEAVGRALGGASVSDDVLLKSLACATWALWALIVACFVAEAVAWWRGREAGRLAVAGLFQPAVRQLVMSAAVLIGVLRPAGGAAVTLVAPTATLAHFVAQAPPSAAPAERAVVDGRSARPSCLVKPRDSLWKLAERHLG